MERVVKALWWHMPHWAKAWWFNRGYSRSMKGRGRSDHPLDSR